MNGPKTTDQRQARGIAQAVIDRLDTLGGADLADEGRALLTTDPVDWGALLGWNRRACDWLIAHHPARPRAR